MKTSLKTDWKAFTTNSGVLLIARVITMALGALELSLIVRALGIERFGLFELIVMYVVIINQFFDMRVWETVVRFLTSFLVHAEHLKAIALLKLCGLIDLATGALAFLSVVITAPFIAHYLLNDVQMMDLIRLYAIYLLVSTLNGTTTGTLRALDQFQPLAVLTVTQKVLQVSLTGILLWQGLGIAGILIAYIASAAVDAALKGLLVVCRFPAQLWPALVTTPLRLIRPHFREIASLIIQTNLHAFLKMLNSGAEILLLGFLSSPLQVGYYRLARRLIDLLSRVAEPFYEAIYPQLTGLWDSGKLYEFRRLVYQATTIMALVMLPIAGLLVLFGEYFVLLVAGEHIVAATPLIGLMALGLAVNFIFLWLHPAALITGKAHWTNITRALQALFWLVGSLLLVPKYGAMGTASLFLFNSLVWVLVMSVQVAKPLWQTSYKEALVDRR